MSDPYRTAAECLVDPIARPNVFVRAWRKAFGQLVYGGEKTCGHCRYWKPKKRWPYESWWPVVVENGLGDCKLLFGKEDTRKEDACERFTARRRYKHRVR